MKFLNCTGSQATENKTKQLSLEFVDVFQPRAQQLFTKCALWPFEAGLVLTGELSRWVTQPAWPNSTCLRDQSTKKSSAVEDKKFNGKILR